MKTAVWPSRDDYQAAVLQPVRCLKDARLHALQVETRRLVGALKVPAPRSGNFGAVYRFSAERGPAYALKVFDKSQPDRQERYRLVHQHLVDRSDTLPNLVSFAYAEESILVRGRWYPGLVMDWADGHLLDLYLKEVLAQRGEAPNGTLCRVWARLVLELQERGIAHGDLQHGNILVTTEGKVKLVDYDGMFVPAMKQAGLTAAEIGLPAYQHPQRYRGYFDQRLDDFAALVILLTLACVDTERWQRYHTDDNSLLLKEADLVRPDESALLAELAASPAEPLRKLAAILKTAARGPLEAIPPFEQIVADKTVKQVMSKAWRPPACKLAARISAAVPGS